MVTFIHRVKFLCVSSIGVTTNQAFWIYVCINTELLRYFLPEPWTIFFVCLFVFLKKKLNFIPWYRTGSFRIGDVLPVPNHISSTFSQRMSEADVTFPLQSFNQRHWIRGTVQLLQQEESWARKGRAHSSWAASCWLRHLLLLLKGQREVIF